MRRILIADNYNSYNLGDAAILEGMRVALAEELPAHEIRLTSAYPDVAMQVHDLPAVGWTPMQLKSRLALASWLLRSATWALLFRLGLRADVLLGPAERRLMESYAWSELVLGAGGAYLREGYRLSALRLWQMLLARAMGRPVMLYAQSIGPLRPGSRLTRLMAFTMARLQLVTLRDPVSARILQEVGIEPAVCEVTADAALALPSPPAEARGDWLPAGEGPLIGVSVLHWHQFQAGSFEAYADAVAQALDLLHADLSARIYFLSTTIAPAGSQMDVSGTSRDDLSAAKDIASRLRQCPPDAVRICSEAMGLEAVQARIGAHDLWLGTRMHSCIFATKAGVPTVAIGYEPKVFGYFELLGQPQRVLDIERLEAKSLYDACRSALDEATDIRAALQERLPDLEARSRQNARLVAQQMAWETP